MLINMTTKNPIILLYKKQLQKSKQKIGADK